eukprot:GHVQ01034137.1.p1 GENE.GHVQ01034137.1~~GHVQ01034137.1.p1  ORF type:complete len:110 (-),score=18.59 GHVQ01034137.1:255-584(-)
MYTLQTLTVGTPIHTHTHQPTRKQTTKSVQNDDRQFHTQTDPKTKTRTPLHTYGYMYTSTYMPRIYMPLISQLHTEKFNATSHTHTHTRLAGCFVCVRVLQRQKWEGRR